MTCLDAPDPCWTGLLAPAGITDHSKVGWAPFHAKDGVVSLVWPPGPSVMVGPGGTEGSIRNFRCPDSPDTFPALSIALTYHSMSFS